MEIDSVINIYISEFKFGECKVSVLLCISMVEAGWINLSVSLHTLRTLDLLAGLGLSPLCILICGLIVLTWGRES